jgi:hypothetical protein
LEHLTNRPAGFDEYGRGHQEFGDRYRQAEEGLAAGQAANNLPTQLRDAIVSVSAVMEIQENISAALRRAELPADVLGPIALARPDLPRAMVQGVLNALLPVARDFIGRLPTRDAALRLRLLRHENPRTRWSANDMVDIAYLAVAVVHCDVVVTEKQWVHELGRSGLLERYGTLALHDVAALPGWLPEAVA